MRFALLRLSLTPFGFPADPESLLPPVGDEHVPPAPARSRELRCEHCECRLTPTGDVLRMSDTARGHLKSAETIEKLKARISELEGDLRDARAKVTELSAVREKSSHALDLEF